jgi:peptidylprolyl isomerase
VLCAALLVPALVSCGGDSDDKAEDDKSSSSASSDSGSGAEVGELEEVSFSGEVGESITADWKSAVETPDEVTTTTLVKGEGDEVAEGDTVSVYLWVADGAQQKQVFSDYDNGAPEAIPYSPEQLDEVFRSLFEDQTYGSRVVAVTEASVVLGEEENQLGVDPADALVIVADLVEKQEESPEPTSDKPEDAEPDTQPSVVEKDGKPTGLDFEGIEEPELDAPVQRVVLKEGDGAALKATDTVTVNYLGSIYDAEAPFDESYSSGQPLTQPLSGLIQGWTIGLTGVKVGSRVLLQIPPAYGYGAQGSGAGIPGNATLWFLIDVVKAESGS